MTVPTPVPEALLEALRIRNRRQRNRTRWQILPDESDAAITLAASVNGSKHQRLANAFKPEGWISEYL